MARKYSIVDGALLHYLNMKFVPTFFDQLLISATNLSNSGECGSRILSQPLASSRTANTKVMANPVVIVNPKRTSSTVLEYLAYDAIGCKTSSQAAFLHIHCRSSLVHKYPSRLSRGGTCTRGGDSELQQPRTFRSNHSCPSGALS